MKDRCVKDFSLPPDQFACIDNWAVESLFSLPKHENPIAKLWDTHSTFTVQYSGNFGRLHDMITLLESSRLLQAHNIKFLFVGDGAKRVQISRYIQEFDLKNVVLYPYQPRDQLKYTLGACDLSIISMIPGSEDTVAPSKFYGIIASGKPVILIGNETSDIAQLVIKYDCGIVISPGDPVALSKAILSLSKDSSRVSRYGLNASRLYSVQFGRSTSTQMYHKLLRSTS